MAIEDTSSCEEQPTEVRTRRAAVLTGVGIVWAAFLASIGLLLLAGLVLVGALGGVAWILGARLLRLDVRRTTARAGASATAVAGRVREASGRSAGNARSACVTAGRSAIAFCQHALTASRASGSAALGRLRTTGRAVGERIFATATRARHSAHAFGSRIAQRSTLRRRDPRIDEALASNSHGIALAKAGRHAEAIDAFDTALALLAETGDRHHEGQVLANLGTVHRNVGGTEAARFCWSRALERLEPGTRESERTAELLGAR